ncbi:hypothetical protein ACIRFH_05660 [Streptomyces sp. NPDC093586]|uniref:hypothetical protein n=1 Tax=Streptomyces sp. NPDC093586 TaxID=3366042 RepID=UPI003820DA48
MLTIGGNDGDHFTKAVTNCYVIGVCDPTDYTGFDLKNVVREGDTVSVSALVSSSGTTVDQCYHFTRRLVADDVTAEPRSACS